MSPRQSQNDRKHNHAIDAEEAPGIPLPPRRLLSARLRPKRKAAAEGSGKRKSAAKKAPAKKAPAKKAAARRRLRPRRPQPRRLRPSARRRRSARQRSARLRPSARLLRRRLRPSARLGQAQGSQRRGLRPEALSDGLDALHRSGPVGVTPTGLGDGQPLVRRVHEAERQGARSLPATAMRGSRQCRGRAPS